MVRGGLGRRESEGERGRRQTGSSTPNTATVRVESIEKEKYIERRRNGEGAKMFLRQEGGQEEER